MILETAVFAIQSDQVPAFQEAFSLGRRYIESSPGFQRLELRQGIEAPDTFILVVWWETLEDHTVTFKGSENFRQWRLAVGHLFAAPPKVFHYSQPI